jgi:hypothetical protein
VRREISRMPNYTASRMTASISTDRAARAHRE